MAAPAFVQASAGTVVTTGTSTMSLTGCTAGNVVFKVWVSDGATSDSGIGAHVNTLRISDGVADDADFFQEVPLGASVAYLIAFVGRVQANGTVSCDLSVGASGADLFGRIYEFSGVAATLGAFASLVISEDGVDYYNSTGGTGTTITMGNITANDIDRLGVTFVAVNANQALAAATGETGGDWIEPVEEFASATGTAATQGVQTADLSAGGTISGGTITISSAAWATLGFALIPTSAIGPSPQISAMSGVGW